ncbi:MAG: class II fructose-1,6-bisphosphate aldolase [Synergistetes bacterium]|nr:class II fructose-1,6-bisphosphate aldolase [Synergistota bacterium]MCX8127958.1 class II fructose-1,6-bisphosphate aldolase [Synergistota bacterium]MDW8192001.1 class II fructose-1,6-bisphosphate aldolase [Synergistota bacterium]
MPLLAGNVLLKKAKEGRFGIGAFNFNNLEFLQAILEAAMEMRSPVILQVSEGGMKYMGLPFLEGFIKSVLYRVEIPVVIHLDHGSSLDAILSAIRIGFTSVMIDASSKPFEENVKITQEVVRIAHSVGVSVEAELGRIVGTEEHIKVSDKEAFFTDPDEAAKFVELTEVDSLAVAIGTAHGVYKGEPKLDFDRLYDIKRKVDIPLVLHGASGVPLNDLQKAISLGICKINIDTDLRLAFRIKLEEMISLKKGEIDPRKFLGPARDAVRETVKEKIKAFGSEGRA